MTEIDLLALGVALGLTLGVWSGARAKDGYWRGKAADDMRVESRGELFHVVRVGDVGKARRPYIIENVVGAPLRAPTLLCGTMFGMRLLRHRLFETSFSIATLMPPCQHRGDEIPVYGNGTPQWHRKKLGRNIATAEQADAMGIDWMTRAELAQAIPPAYSQWLAERWLESRAAA